MVDENVPIAALAAGVRSAIGESGLGGGSGGNGRSSPGVNPFGGVGLGVGAGVGLPPGGVGAGVGVGFGLPGGVGPPPDGGVGFGLPGGVVSGGVISSPRTRYQSFLTGVTL